MQAPCKQTHSYIYLGNNIAQHSAPPCFYPLPPVLWPQHIFMSRKTFIFLLQPLFLSNKTAMKSKWNSSVSVSAALINKNSQGTAWGQKCMTEIKCGWNVMLVVLFVMLVPLLCCRIVFAAQRTSRRHSVPNDSLCTLELTQRALSLLHSAPWLHWPPVHLAIDSRAPSPFSVCFSLIQYLQPKLPQCLYYCGVTCISAEVNEFKREWFMCCRKCLTSWLTPCCNGKTENGLNSPKG